MMRLATPRHSVDHAPAGGGLLLRMRAWFARSATAYVAALREDAVLDDATTADTGSNHVNPTRLVSHDVPPDSEQSGKLPTAVLLPFPIHGEALLVKLADQLRGCVADSAAKHDPFVLTLSRRPRSRLTIDRAAYVEFHAERATYYLVIEMMHDTRITVETIDFDTVVKFVAQYVTDRLCDAAVVEAVS